MHTPKTKRNLFRPGAPVPGWLCLALLPVWSAASVEMQPLQVTGAPEPGLVPVPAEKSGITFSSLVSRETARAHATLVASGVAAGDVDGDGWCDLYFCSPDGRSILYRNLGNWRFEDITDRSGLPARRPHAIGAAFADVNGDGRPDLIATARGGPNALYLNDGGGRFHEEKDFPGRTSKRGSTSVALADIEGDGDLDLYICNYRAAAYADDHRDPDADPALLAGAEKLRAGGKTSAEFQAQFYLAGGELQEKGEPDELLINDGKGRFTRTEADRFTLPPGAPPPGALEGWGLAAQFHDVNGDGAPDLYVCNDFHTPDRLWLNDGKGRFTLAPMVAQRHQSYYAMAVDFADINGDGAVDFFVGDMLSRDHARRKRQMGNMRSNAPQTDNFGPVPQITQNTLFLNRGDGTFADIAPHAGVKASEWTWGAVFMDADLDGLPDLLVSCGMIHDWMDSDIGAELAGKKATMNEIKDHRVKYPALKTRNLLFHNKGDLHFEEAGARFGLKAEEASGGMIPVDLDNDGDLDVVISNTGAPAEIYRNDVTAPRIAVRLRGRAPNTAGVGAKVRLISKKLTQEQEVIAGGRYASGGDPLLVFAAPADRGPFDLLVTWRDGRTTTVTDVAANQLCLIPEAESVEAKPAPVPAAEPLFEDVSQLLDHTYRENKFDDFATQPLLPNRLSRLGPGVSWIDLDADGDDDILIGAAGGETAGLFENLGGGKLRRMTEQENKLHPSLDLTTILGFRTSSPGLSLLLGVSAWEAPQTKAAAQLIQISPAGAWQPGAKVTGDQDAIGPLALADVDHDGDLDFFIGGRVRLGRYPEPADSTLLINGTTPAGPATAWSDALKHLGLASGATFADLNDDGWADLLVACEWGPVRVFMNTGRGFVDETAARGLDALTGWWNGVAAGDLDGDGRLDFVATNWGQNSKYEGAFAPDRPLQIYYGDFDGNGTFDIVEAHEDKFTRRLVPERGLSCSSGAMPFIRLKTPTFRLFGEADLPGIYGDRLKNSALAEARELRHMAFLNLGAKFEAVPLPVEAQLAPAFGVVISDFDGDGR